jgi:CheY-like chemotaxis protein
MNRILLADDSPHAQRMGERILREDGYEVVSVTDGETALLRLADVDPDVIIADVFLPGRSGMEMCRHVKSHPNHQHVRMILTAGMLESFDEAEATAAGADAIIKKPFEASVVLETIRPLAEGARAARKPAVHNRTEAAPEPAAEPPPIAVQQVSAPPPEAPEPQHLEPQHLEPQHLEPPRGPVSAASELSDQERIRAAVIVALDSAFPALVEQITEQVLSVRKIRANEN